jgi:O-antigen ligase
MLLLVSGLVLPPVAGYGAVYATIVTALLLSMVAWLRERRAFSLPGFRLTLFALVLMIVATVFVGPVLIDWAGPGVVALLVLAFGPVGARQVSPSLLSVPVVTALCLSGALIGAGAGLHEVLSGVDRAGVGNNPIHYSGLVVILGFCALAGIVSSSSPWRLLFLIGPASAFAAAFASGSRGPLLAALVLSLVAWVVLAIWYRRKRMFWIASAVLATLGIWALLFVGDGARAFSGLIGHFTGEFSTATANSDEIRRMLYWGGLRAFMDSPFWGHGFSDLMSAASQHMPAEDRFTRFDHLHNDAIDFLVTGGILGGAAYLAILAAPLAILRHRAGTQARAPVLFAIMLSSSYLLLGLTNAMIGVLPQTVLFAVLLGCVLAFDLDLKTPA